MCGPRAHPLRSFAPFSPSTSAGQVPVGDPTEGEKGANERVGVGLGGEAGVDVVVVGGVAEVGGAV